MAKLQELEDKIAKARKNIAEWEAEAEELRQAERAAAVEEIKRRMAELGLSYEDIVGKRIKTTKAANGRYYLLNGRKFPQQRGRLARELSEYKAQGEI